MGVIVGGRVGWCIFYGHDVIAENWLNVFHIWDGGMSFHGGMLGVLAATLLFARAKHKHPADVLDFVAPLPGIGLMAGRIWEFHQWRALGQADGLALGIRRTECRGRADLAGTPPSSMRRLSRVWCCSWCSGGSRASRDRVWRPLGLFLLMYGCARFTVEWVRLPDANIGYLVGDWLTMGMLLTTPMILGRCGDDDLCLQAPSSRAAI